MSAMQFTIPQSLQSALKDLPLSFSISSALSILPETSSDNLKYENSTPSISSSSQFIQNTSSKAINSSLNSDSLNDDNWYDVDQEPESKISFDFEPSLHLHQSEHNFLLHNRGFVRADVVSPTGRGKHSIVCRHWLKGMCMKGDFCDFLHQLDYSRMPVCRFFAKYPYCADMKRGICPFKHPLSEGKEDSDLLEEQPQQLQPQNISNFSQVSAITTPISTQSNLSSTQIDSSIKNYTSNLDDQKQYGFTTTTSLNDNIPALKKRAISNINKSNQCLHYFLGYCKLGNKCNKTHTRLSKYQLPELLPDWFLSLIVANKEVFPVQMDEHTRRVLLELSKICTNLNAVSTISQTSSHTTSYTTSLNTQTISSNVSGPSNSQTKFGDQNTGIGQTLQGRSNLTSSSTINLNMQSSSLSTASKSTQASLDSSMNKGIPASTVFQSETVSSSLLSSNSLESSTDLFVGIPGLCSPFGKPHDVNDTVKCFIIKCNQMTNIYYSVLYGIWATGKANTRRLVEAFKNYTHVVLLFSANESGGFQGYGRMMSLPYIVKESQTDKQFFSYSKSNKDSQNIVPSASNLYSGIWGNISSKLGGNFRVQWIKQCKVEFEELGYITNRLNQDLPLKKSRDGTELPLDMAILICTSMAKATDEDLLAGTPLNTHDRIDHSTFFIKLAYSGELGAVSTQINNKQQNTNLSSISLPSTNTTYPSSQVSSSTSSLSSVSSLSVASSSVQSSSLDTSTYWGQSQNLIKIRPSHSSINYTIPHSHTPVHMFPTNQYASQTTQSLAQSNVDNNTISKALQHVTSGPIAGTGNIPYSHLHGLPQHALQVHHQHNLHIYPFPGIHTPPSQGIHTMMIPSQLQGGNMLLDDARTQHFNLNPYSGAYGSHSMAHMPSSTHPLNLPNINNSTNVQNTSLNKVKK